MKWRLAWVVSLVFVLAFAGTGCGMVKDFRKSRHLKKAEQYYAEGKYKEATIEYRNALQYDPQNLDALKKLGLAYYESGQLGEAFPPLRRYHEQNLSDLEVRQKVGTIYLLGRAYDKAREQAEAILAVEPLNLDALALLAETAQDPDEILDAIRRIEDNRAALGEPDRVGRVLGVLYARNQDLPRAEQEFEAAVGANPDSPESHLALARLHLGKRELEEAEKEFKVAAELSQPGSFARLQLADFYLLTNRPDDAQKALEEITAQAPDAFPAWLRLAEIAFAQGRLEDAQRALDPVLEANPDDASGADHPDPAARGSWREHRGGRGGDPRDEAEPEQRDGAPRPCGGPGPGRQPGSRPDRGQGRRGAGAGVHRRRLPDGAARDGHR